jgi:hypothetical protein
MSHIHVCLVSDQAIPNLTTALQFNPDTTVLLSTNEMKDKAKRLETVLKNKGLKVKTLKISAYDINDVITVSESLLNDCKGCKVSLNITGGTKIGTLGTFQVFYTASKPIFYVNTKDNEIIKLYPEKEQQKYPIEISISIKDYLAVYGFNVKSYVKDDSYIYKRKKVTDYLANLVIHRPNIIGEINYKLQNFEEKSYPLKINITKNKQVIKLYDILKDSGLVKIRNKSTIEIPDVETAKYLNGIWFEEYVYMMAKSLGADEVKLNVKGVWDTVGKHPPTNEFDILISKGNRLFYISCKTANPDRKIDDTDETIGKEYLYELDSISDSALGLFGKRMLASARAIKNDYVRKRAEILKIDIADGQNIATLKGKLQQWLSK